MATLRRTKAGNPQLGSLGSASEISANATLPHPWREAGAHVTDLASKYEVAGMQTCADKTVCK